MLSVSSLRVRQRDQMHETRNHLTQALAERLDRSPADLRVRWFAAAVVSVWETALMTWVENDGQGDLLAMLDEAIAFLVAGCPL